MPDSSQNASHSRHALAHERRWNEVLDRQSGEWVSLAEFLSDNDYGDIVNLKRVALENDLTEGRVRYVCPWCESAMVLRSVPTRDRSEDRFYFKHKNPSEECQGGHGLSAAEICARKFAHMKEGAEHKRFKHLVADSLAADPAFSDTRVETRWVDVAGTRWRQPDVQSVWRGERVAFEVQLSTTFLHVMAERMTFYRRNDGRLLWLFRDLDASQFRLAEDDLFYSNNRNAFRVTEQTAKQSKERGRFMLECYWHEPSHVDSHIVAVPRREIVDFESLVFDVSQAGAPRAFFFDYDAAVARMHEEKAAQERTRAAAGDQRLRDLLEKAVVGFDRGADGNADWQAVRREFRQRGFVLPNRLVEEGGPFYLLQAAYSAKAGQPVACGFKNLIGLANNLFLRHKSVLWVWSVMMTHYSRERLFAANGDMAGWRMRRDEYRRGWLERQAAYAPDRRHDLLLAFLFPDAAEALAQDPAHVEAARGRTRPARGARG